MTTYVGGLRARLVKESVYKMVKESLTTLGWFNPARQHIPIQFVDTAFPDSDEIPFNALALSDEDQTEADEELGSMLAEHRWQMYLDFYAENSTLGLHLSQDVRDILAGRFATIGRTQPTVDVYDYTMATPPYIFTVQIENVIRDRAHDFPKRQLQHWYEVRFEIVDYYGTDEDT